jgi:outer membrane protein
MDICMTRIITGIFLSLLITFSAQAETLLEIYEQAKRSDPAINEAEANMMAQMEAKPQARALLLPQLDASAGLDKTKSEGSSLQPGNVGGEFGFANVDSERDVDSSNWSVDLDQTLFNVDQWRKLKKADKEVARAKADYDFAQQDLIIRVSEAYFNVLAAQDQLASERAAKDAIGRQLEQAERRFEVGLIAITDVKEAQAGFDDAIALEIAAQRALATAKEALREITGEYPQVLAAPADEFPLIPPEPQIEQDWVDVSLQQNLALESARIGADITRSNVSIAKGGHYPTLGLFASYGNNQQEGDTTVFNDLGDVTNDIDTDNDSARVGIQFRLPIYSGGGVSSQVQEQVYLHRAARENFEKVARQTERETRDAYLGVIAEIARVQALARSEDSNQTALEATEAGYDVGTRTTVDVLNARQSLFLAQTQYSRSKYDYLINVLRLKRAAGTLQADDVAEINGWLVLQETLPSTPGRGATPDVELQPGTPTSGGMLELEKEREAAESDKDSVE